MTTVTKIQASTHVVPEATLALCRQLGLAVPPSATSLSFELHNTNTAIANGLRRCIDNEVPVQVMSFNDVDLKTNDPYIIAYELQSRLNQIPIKQGITEALKLNVYNNTDVPIPIYSSNIGGPELMSGNFIVTYLRPNTSIIIDKINITTGIGYLNSAVYTFPGHTEFHCLDMDEKKSSMLQHPNAYRLVVAHQSFIDPRDIVLLALTVLIDKLTMLESVVRNPVDDLSYIEITELPGGIDLKIFNETYTIGNIISYYCYKVDPTISNVNCRKAHPTHNYITVEVYHSTPKQILVQSIEMAKNELIVIKGKF
jgi:DNA-directed RNA polymerase subunit L